MLSAAYLTGVSTEVVEIFAEVEQEITADVARRILRMGSITSASKWQIQRAQQLGLLSQDVVGALSAATGKSKRTVSKLMAEAGVKSLAYDDAIHRLAGLEVIPLAESPAMQAILLQGVDSTMKLLNNFTKTTLGASNSAFIASLDKAFIKIHSGAYSPQSAIHAAIRQLASGGVTSIAYGGNRSLSIEGAVRRCVTTGVNQSVAKLQLARMEETGTNLVETSSHAGARPTHAEWQGMVFMLEGSSREYGNFYRETDYGSGDGLCGWNCYHSFFPFYEGLSTRSFSHDPAADAGRNNDEEYLRQQKQRYYERRVREAKRACTVYDAAVKGAATAGEEAAYREDFTNASVLLKRREAALQEYLDKTGRRRQREREMVGGFNRSVSSKAVWANRKAQRT